MESVKEYLIDYGFTDKDASKIIKRLVSTYNEETFLKNVKDSVIFLTMQKYTKKEIIKMFKESISLVTNSAETLQDKMNYFCSLGLPLEEVKFIFYKFPNTFGLSTKKISERIEFFEGYSFTIEEVLKMFKKQPELVSIKKENIKNKMDILQSYGYLQKDIVKIGTILPSFFCLASDNIEQKLSDLESLGYNRSEVVKMTSSLPSLFSYSFENIKRKVDFLRSIDLDFILLEDTLLFMQSFALTYARYNFLKNKDIVIGRDDYKSLFCKKSRFKNLFNITSEELINMYNYEKESEGRK